MHYENEFKRQIEMVDQLKYKLKLTPINKDHSNKEQSLLTSAKG